jgi:hypothetical protein
MDDIANDPNILRESADLLDMLRFDDPELDTDARLALAAKLSAAMHDSDLASDVNEEARVFLGLYCCECGKIKELDSESEYCSRGCWLVGQY